MILRAFLHRDLVREFFGGKEGEKVFFGQRWNERRQKSLILLNDVAMFNLRSVGYAQAAL